MSQKREPALQSFVDGLMAAFGEATPEADATAFLGRLQAGLALTANASRITPVLPAVCAHLPQAYAAARLAAPSVAGLCAAFEALAPRLAWKPRASGGPHASANWPGGHANAVIIGEGGLEERSDIAIGASLLAPLVRYPDHNHPPEELYMILTQGRFQHGTDDWIELGPGCTFHNPPAIKHAMASKQVPLLAIWTMVTTQASS